MLTEERRSLVTLLYPWYKEEVFRRRAQMAWLSGSAMALLLVLLALITVLPHGMGEQAGRLWLIPGLLLFSGLMTYLVLQQHDRHRMAKQVLIELERELKLFEAGEWPSGHALYPIEWQTAWQRDRSVTIYLAMIGAMTLFTIGAILMR
jgi:hypothetical protein